MKISVVTPSVRPEGLEIVMKSLKRQTLKDFEWIVISPRDNLPFFVKSCAQIIQEPPKRSGDYYGLNKAFNAGFKRSKGELIVSVVDLLWFSSNVLQGLWDHYQANSKICVTAVGDQYERNKNDRPEVKVWSDPRKRADFGTFYEVSPREMELCVASLPKKAVKECGGLDEKFDEYAALSEKEMCYRLDKMGYKFYIDQTIEYRAIKHPRLSEDWDEKYKQGIKYYDECLKQIARGDRRAIK